MNATELMYRLREQDVLLCADGGSLRFDAPDGAVDDALLAALREHKEELLAALAADTGPRVVGSGPCTWTQNAVAAKHEVLAPGTYNVAVRLDVRGPLDTTALETAWQALAERHEALHTRFLRYGERFVQEVLDTRPAPVRHHGAPAPDDGPGGVDEALDRWCAQLAAAPFDLAEGSLIRADLAEVAEDRWVLAIVQHHMITDAVSLDLLLSDLTALYTAAATGEPAGLPPLTARFADFARWQRTRLDAQGTEGLLAHWREELDGAPLDVPLPGDRPRPGKLSGAGAMVTVRIEPPLARRLDAFARAEGVTLYPVLATAFGRLLTGLVGRNEVVVSTNSADRGRKEFERLVGLLAVSLPLRLRLDPHATAREAVQRGARTTLDALDHQGLALGRLAELLKLRERPGAGNFSQVWFILNPEAAPVLRPHGLEARVGEIVVAGARSDLGLLVVPEDGGLTAMFELSTDILDPATVRGWGERFVELLQRLVDDPGVTVEKW